MGNSNTPNNSNNSNSPNNSGNSNNSNNDGIPPFGMRINIEDFEAMRQRFPNSNFQFIQPPNVAGNSEGRSGSAGSGSGPRAFYIRPGSNFIDFLDNAQLEYALAMSRQDYERKPQLTPTDPSILLNLKETCLDLVDIEEGNEHCVICMEPQHCGDLAIKLPCFHAFHKRCVFPWLEKNNTCPVCRLDLNEFYQNHDKNATVRDIKKSNNNAEEPNATTTLNDSSNEERRERSGTNHSNVTSGSNVSGDHSNLSNEERLRLKEERRKRREEELRLQRERLEGLGLQEHSHVEGKASSGENKFPLNLAEIDTWSLKQLKQVLKRLGLEDSAKRFFEKPDLIELVKSSCNEENNKSLNVDDLKSRLARMEIRYSRDDSKETLENALNQGISKVVRST